MSKEKRKAKDLVLCAFITIVGFWWVLSAASLLTATVPMTIVFIITSFFMVWFYLANFVTRGAEDGR